MVNLIGQTLLQQFRVDELVASGKTGPVYKVWDTKNNIALAMKIIYSDHIEDQNSYEHLQREATALDSLQHPNIVPFYGLYKTSQFAFLLEQFIDGVSLREIMKINRGRLSIPEALAYMQTLCSALGYAHANGVVHSSLKTANVMVDWSGRVYLTDFMIKQSKETGIAVVDKETASYMAPEQFGANSIVSSMNIYSLGVLSFELLTGRCPFLGNESKSTTKGESASERIRYAHLHLPPPDPKWLNPLIPSALALIILKCLEKEPRERFATTEDILNALAGLHIALPPQVSVPPKEKVPPRINTPNKNFSKKIIPILLIIFMFCGFLCVFGFYKLPPWTAEPTASINTVTNISATNTFSTIFTETSIIPVNTSQSSNPTPVPSETQSIVANSGLEPIPASYKCADKSKIKLQVGALGEVRKYDVNLRTEPIVPEVWDANVIRVLHDGDKLRIIGGPTCAYNGTWWEVLTESDEKGWVREIQTSNGRLVFRINP